MVKPRHTWPLVIAATLTCAACVSNPTAPSGANPAGPSTLEPSPASPVAAQPLLPTGAEPVNLNPADFSADITNAYWPMKPGTRWVYRNVEEGNPPQDIVVVATTETKKLANGITARVVRDTARSKGQLVEDTIDWYAQDKAGNVWYMGEQTAEYENGKVSSRAGSWEAGKDGAMPGIMLPAQPQDGQKYRQEYKKGEAEDNGEVIATDAPGPGHDRPLQELDGHHGHEQRRENRGGVQVLCTSCRTVARAGRLRRRIPRRAGQDRTGRSGGWHRADR